MHSKPNEQLFHKQVVIEPTLFENSSNIFFYLFPILNYKIEQHRKHNEQLFFRWPYCWGRYTHGYNNMEHWGTTTEDRLETVSNRLLGVGDGVEAETCFTGSKPSPFASAAVRNI